MLFHLLAKAGFAADEDIVGDERYWLSNPIMRRHDGDKPGGYSNTFWRFVGFVVVFEKWKHEWTKERYFANGLDVYLFQHAFGAAVEILKSKISQVNAEMLVPPAATRVHFGSKVNARDTTVLEFGSKSPFRLVFVSRANRGGLKIN